MKNELINIILAGLVFEIVIFLYFLRWIRDKEINLYLGTTKIIMLQQKFVGTIKVTECCKIGPLTTEKYCPNCGRFIIKTK